MKLAKTIQKREGKPSRKVQKGEVKAPHVVLSFSPHFRCGAQGNQMALSQWESRVFKTHYYNKKTSPSLGPSVAVDRPTKRLPQHQLWKEMMQKTKQELGRLRKLPPIKGNDHRSPALQWSLFILNMELRKNGLEVGELIYWISLICRDIKSINLLGNNAKMVRSNLIMQNVYESTQLPQLLLSSI